MCKWLTSLFILLASYPIFSQPNKKKLDIQSIKSMCGCYSITFDYAETFATDPAYKIHDPYHAAASAEWIFIEEEDENKIVIQHLLVINDSTIVKHWRQDWLFENSDLYQYYTDMDWKYNKLSKSRVKGQWTQKVYQVDDSPRYEGSATWHHYDVKHFWENTADAPLPRREHTKRNDYNVMRRTNRHILTDSGWLHEQDNLKIIRTGIKDSVLVAEKGLNNYTKIPDSACQPAMDWWKKNSSFWKLVRAEWNEVYSQKQNLQFEKKVDGKLLWQALFELGDDIDGKKSYSQELIRERIGQVIKAYLIDKI